MYKRLILASVAMVVMVSPFAYAESTPPMITDYQASLIQANCISVKTTLTRIHANDALSRVHLGQEYETISTKLMAPMNSRIALSKLDGVELTKTTVKFNASITEFRNLYKQYEQTMSRALQIKCSEQPVEFYNVIVQAQVQRANVRASVEKLASLASQYRQQVNDVRVQLNEAQKQGSTT